MGHTYQATQTGRHEHSTAQFRTMNKLYEQQDFYHRGSFRSNTSLYSNFLHEYYNNALPNSNMATNHPLTILSAPAKGTIYKGNLISSVKIEQTILQVALSSIEIFNSTKSKFKAWTVHRKCSTNIWSGHATYSILQNDRSSTFITQ